MTKKKSMYGGGSRAFNLLLVASLGVTLSACGGGSGGASSLTPTPSYSVSGSVVAAVVRGAEVSVYKIVNGQQGEKIESGTTALDGDGTYTISVGSYSGPVIVVATGGTYIDEATGIEINLNTAGPGGAALSLRAVHAGQAADLTIVITPLTELATRKALDDGLTAESINAANALVAKEFLGDEAFDITATVPADVTDPSSASASDAQKEYGLMLAGFSQAENNSASTLGALLNTYGDDLLEDGSFDNENKLPLNQALLEFMNDGSKNHSEMGPNDTDLDEGIAPTNTPPTATAGSVVITDTNGGDVVVGDSLVGSYDYSDPENDAEGTSTFRWLRGETVVGNTLTHTVTVEDSGADLVFEVTPVAEVGLNLDDSFSSAAVNVVNSAPVVSGVSFDGGPSEVFSGDTLTGIYLYKDSDNDAEGESTFRWFRGGSPIDGETSSTYTVLPSDSGFSISFEITPMALTGVISGEPVVAPGITIDNLAPVVNSVIIMNGSGTAAVVVGDVLTGNYAYNDHEENAEGSSTFRWLRGDTEVGTALAYTVTAADSGAMLSFEVTPVAAVGSSPGSPVKSAGVGVENSVPVASGVSITDTNGGDVVVGDVLTGSYAYTDDDHDAEGTSTFRWLRDGVAIAAAVDSTYTVVADDSGTVLIFEVTPAASAGVTPGVAQQASSGLAVVNSAPVASDVSITDDNAGDLVVGDVLTAAYTYTDLDNDVEGISTFRWLRDGVKIAGATTASYVLVADDNATTLTFEVTPVADTGIALGMAMASTGITAVNSAPLVTSVSIVDDNGDVAVVGDTLTGSYIYSDLDDDAEGTSTFRWLRDGTEVGVALTYTVVVADSGAVLIFETTPVAVAGISPGVAMISVGLAIANSAPVVNGVSISDDNGGTALAGDILTASYLYSDIDGDLEGVSTFRWLRDGVPIDGATALTYTLTAEDASASINFEITPVALTGTLNGNPVVSSELGVSNTAPVASLVSITDGNSGDVVVGDTLTGSYSYSDVEGDLQGTSTFRWLRNGVPIDAAVADTYVAIIADTGATLIFEVTPVAVTGAGVGSVVTSPGVVVANSAPVASSVSATDNNGGDTVVGDSLVGTYSFIDVDGDSQGISVLRWLRDGTEVGTGLTYTVVAADSGTTLVFEVTPVAVGGVSSGVAVVSTGLVVTNSAPVANGVNISDDNGGTALAGDTLTASYLYSDIDGDFEGVSTFRWLRDGVAIDGATALTYILTAEDASASINFEVIPVALAGTLNGNPVVSNELGVSNTAPVASVVSILDDNGGDVVVGDTLTGSYSYSDVEGDLQGTSTFRWLRNGVPIDAAVASTYVAIAADTGATLIFEVTPVAVTGAGVGAVVTSAGVVVANSAPVASSVSATDNNGGDTVVGDSLVGTYSFIDVDGDSQGISVLRWLRDGTEVGTGLAYTVVAADSGTTLVFEVTPVAVGGVSSGVAVVSTGLVVTNSAPVANDVNISDDNGGTALAGDTLTASYLYSDIDGDLEGVSTFRWLRNGEAIAGATASTYTLVAMDAGTQIKFEVLPVAVTGTLTGSPVLSGGLGVNNNAPVASVVSVSDDNGGDVVVGDALTGSYSYSDVEADPEGASTFRWLRSGAPINLAIASTYTVTATDTGATLTFEVTPIATVGTAVGNIVVSPVGVIVVNSAPIASGVNITDDNGGSAVVGDALTAAYSFTDVDDDVQGSSTFRWLRAGVEIGGATTLSYVVTIADIANPLTFEVTPVASAGVLAGTPVVSSGINAVNSAPTASAVSISDDNGGDPVVGDSLTGIYTYGDIDSDDEGVSTYRWLRDGVEVASTLSYVLLEADSGKTLILEVTPIAVAGELVGSAASSAGVVVVNSVPIAATVAITDDNAGDAVVGDTLTGGYVYSDVDGDLEASSGYKWLRDGVAIDGALAATYTIVAEDSGKTLIFEVTPGAATGIAMGVATQSAGISTVNSAPEASDVAIADSTGGDAVVGDVLTGSHVYSDVDNDAQGISTFRWLRGGVAIVGETASTYTLVVDDLGSVVIFEVTPIAATGLATGTPVVSVGVSVVNSVPVANTVAIVDDNGGSAVVGDNLTGSYVYSDVDTDIEGATTFRWLRDGAPINAATASTYIVTIGDVGAVITFEVTPLATTGASPGVAVASVGISIANSAPVANGVGIVDDDGGSGLVGDSLTGNYTYSDADSDAEGVSTFRWLRDGTEISGATASSYVVAVADAGAILTFEVTPVASTGTLVGSTVTSAGLALFNSAPVASSVSITEVNTGATVVGDTLAGSYVYSDLDNDTEGASTFRWLRDGVEVATSQNYMVVAGDSGTTLVFEVTPIATAGTTSGSAVQSGGIVVINSVPVAADVSVTDGNGSTTVVGDELTGNYTYSDVDGDTENGSTFRWLRNGAYIDGVVTQMYTVTPADSDTTLTFEVTPISTGSVATGIAVVSDPGVAIVNSVPTASAVGITGDTAGNAAVGDVLTGNYTFGDVDEDLEGVSTYRWLSDGTPIVGAEMSTYTVVVADSGKTLTFEVTPVALTGALAGSPVVTSGGIAVLNSVPVATSVVITGDSGGGAGVGALLTGTYVYADVDLDLEGASTFRWLRDAAPISGETGLTYTTAVGDVDTSITFEVTPVALTGVGALAGAPVVSAGIAVYTSPMVTDVARFLDVNGNGTIDSGDQLVVPFDQPVTVNAAGIGDFTLPVMGDSLGASVAIAAGPASNEVTITLGSSPLLVTQNTFSGGTLATSSPSGIDVAGAIALNAIESSLTGLDAVASTPIDIIPTFTDSGQSLGSSNSRAIALGDVDGDGDLDIVVGNEDQSNKVYINNGSGIFSSSGQSLGSSTTFGIALGDVDGINGIDIVVGNHAQANRVYINNGSGTFSDTGQLLGLYGVNVDLVNLYGDTRAIGLADFDSDGDLDIVAVNESTTTHPNHLFINNGDGTFVDGAILPNFRASRTVAVGDVTGDGNEDFIAGNFNSKHDLYAGDGMGGFSSSIVIGTSYPTRAVALGDVNGDGDLDEVVGNVNKINRVFINGGSGNFINKTQTWTAANGTNGVVLVDVDGDGDLDMVAVNYGQDNLVYLNDGTGLFVDSGQVLGSNNSTAIAAGDLNGDGIDDLVISNDGQPNRVYFASP